MNFFQYLSYTSFFVKIFMIFIPKNFTSINFSNFISKLWNYKTKEKLCQNTFLARFLLQFLAHFIRIWRIFCQTLFKISEPIVFRSFNVNRLKYFKLVLGWKLCSKAFYKFPWRFFFYAIFFSKNVLSHIKCVRGYPKIPPT